MALPKLNTPTYELEVPSTDEKIKYRPFLVKEEKILMIAMESKDNTQIVNAVKDIVSACTFDKVDISNMPMFDVEYSYGSSNQIVKINVGFAYKQWFNLTTDHIAGMTFGNSQQTIHDVKSVDKGLFGRLPIELQRAGREVFNSAKRQVPIGRLFRGKLFPPFT